MRWCTAEPHQVDPRAARADPERSASIASVARAGEKIENPLTGEEILFVRTAAETDGELLELEDVWSRPGQRAPEHVHPEMEERWELLSGLAAFRIGGVERTATAGEVVVAPAGVPHLAWNAGEKPVVVRIQMRPALRWEQLVERLFALARSSHERGEERMPVAALAKLLGEYPRELALPPAPSEIPRA